MVSFYGESDVNEELKQRLQKGETWQRGLYMLFFIIVYSIAKFVIFTVMLFQFLAVLFVGKINEQILKFSQNLSTYVYQVVLYLTYNTEQRPFPFGDDWPTGVPKEPEQPPLSEQSAQPEQINQKD